MDDIKHKLLSYFQSEAANAPDDYCPNCWGRQQYDSVFRQMYKDRQIDVKNKQKGIAFIEKFVLNRVDGIKLIKDEGTARCPACRTTFPDPRDPS